jgi:prepilin-type N-terminal cleavage/methylation domain-containing protein/prepilin-type processing-associated H-X9-DG protein
MLNASARPITLRRRQGFTLIELLVSIGIIVLLLAVLLPAVRYGIAYARGFRCQMSLRDTAFEFSVFADDTLHGNRGDDNANSRFRLENFVESQYGLSEFWRHSSQTLVQRTTADDAMRCSEVAGPVQMRRNIPCRQGALSPTQNVSFTFNKRLDTPEVKGRRGAAPTQVWLSSAVLASPSVPLVWDLDGDEAARRDIVPHFTAPGLNSVSDMANDAYWMPGFRHSSRVNIALIDGSVHATKSPLDENWDWAYQPKR